MFFITVCNFLLAVKISWLECLLHLFVVYFTGTIVSNAEMISEWLIEKNMKLMGKVKKVKFSLCLTN
jgi:hypothetical protein